MPVIAARSVTSRAPGSACAVSRSANSASLMRWGRLVACASSRKAHKSLDVALANRTYRVPQDQPAARLDRTLRALSPGTSWNAVRRAIETGKVSIEGQRVTDPTRLVSPGTSIAVDL